MPDSLKQFIDDHRDACYTLLRRFAGLNRPFLLRSDIQDIFSEFCSENAGAVVRDSVLAETIAPRRRPP